MSLPVLTIHNGQLSFGVKPLFTDLHINILEGEHLCLIGRNGEGKSTLLKVLCAQMELDQGDFFVKPHLKVHYLPQDLGIPTGKTALDVALRYTELPHEAQELLDALEVCYDKDTTYLSGGEKRRILLAQALAGNPDVLLLDEPTNHLDLRAIAWLEKYLNAYKGAFLTISHDRRFLANVTRGMLWMDRKKLRKCQESYAFFPQWEEIILTQDQREMDRIESKLRLEEHWKMRGVTARRKRNQGRLERLMHMRERRKGLLSGLKRQVDFESKKEGVFGSQLIVEAKEISKSFEGSLNLKPFSTRIFKGDRIAIIGPNGAGKSTLLGLLMGQISPDQGRIKLSKTLNLAYFEQERGDMNPKETPWQYLCPNGGDQVDVQGASMHVVGYLKRFLFDERQARGQISILSGGEKNRLQLAKVLAQPSNVLILDEPTNDLDMDTLDLLLDMLSDYEGTLILISHDRDFVDQLVTGVFAIHPTGDIIECVGGYQEYIDKYGASALLGEAVSKKTKKIEVELPRVILRKRTYKDQREYEQIPHWLADLDLEKQNLEKELHDPDLYISDSQRFDALSLRLEELIKRYDMLETRWLELASEENE